VRLAFIDGIPWDYNVRSVLERPLGGSQSAVCYLATQLAADGQQVWLINNSSKLGRIEGVEHFNLVNVTPSQIRTLDLDAVVIMNDSRMGGSVRDLAGQTPIVLWVQANTDARSTAPLADTSVADRFDAFVFVSEWQRQRYLTYFGLALEKTRILRNAIAPAFENRGRFDGSILAARRDPPFAVYTSVPTRGLATLVEIWPQVHRHMPKARLKVFSSMSVYHTSEGEDLERLYELCRTTAGIDYMGSVTQPALAQELRGAAVLAYPSEFAETSCISALEAMASGAIVVASDYGALSETTAGFGRLVGTSPNRARYMARFAVALAAALNDVATRDPKLNEDLRAQIAFINDRYTWQRRAREWTDWLARDIVRPRSVA
jgi:glycosyltransferase involved in cell wall biosynthesis